MISTRTSLVVLVFFLAALGLQALPVGAAVYRYVDDDGRLHFSDSLTSVPPRYRDQVSDISEELRSRPGINVIPALNQGEDATGDGTGADSGLEPNAAPELAESFDFEASRNQGMRAAAGQLWSRFGIMLLVCVLLIILVGILLGALILMLACKLAAPDTPDLFRACAIVSVQGLVGLAINVAVAGVGLALGISDDHVAASLGLSSVDLLVSLAAYAGVLSAMTDLGFLRAVWVTIVSWLLILLIIAVPLVSLVFSLAI